jgi:hypothetical protein
VPASAPDIVACHCEDCQRRSGSPFGVTAYYVASDVAIVGKAIEFTRRTAEGNIFENHFCPRCGSTVFTRTRKRPDLIGITVGTIADPAFPAPGRSMWEASKHHWVEMPGNIAHFETGRHPIT